MVVLASDPIRAFEHSHDHLTQLALEVGEKLHGGTHGASTGEARESLVALLDTLRDELLHHFAVEEEGLFPFIRSKVSVKAEAVDRLAHAHDIICGAVVRLAHLARTSPVSESPALLALHARFESAYVVHSREEADLLSELGRTLNERQRHELVELLRGL
jgi:iron-sulfur cluster repair protein YtfE (RIC family)